MATQSEVVVASGQNDRLAVNRHLGELAQHLAALEPGDIASVRRLLRGVASDKSIVSDVKVVPARGSPVPGTWLKPENADPARRFIYFHGLSFMAGDLATYGGFVSRLATAAQACALFVEYRLAPEHLFPAAHDDCVQAILWAQQNGPDGASKADCTIAGDSCGASLVLATAIAARRKKTPAKSVILFAPFVDLAVNGEAWARNHGRDPLLTADVARSCAALYAPGVDACSPELSPIYDDLSQLPPIQIHASSSDPAFDDAARLAALADRAGVPTESHIWSDVPHSWFLFHDKLSAARQSIELAGSFSRRL